MVTASAVISYDSIEGPDLNPVPFFDVRFPSYGRSPPNAASCGTDNALISGRRQSYVHTGFRIQIRRTGRRY